MMGLFCHTINIIVIWNSIYIFYAIFVMTKWAETGLVPPATGVIVRALAVPLGFWTVNIEFAVVVVIKTIPVIWSVPVALPLTV